MNDAEAHRDQACEGEDVGLVLSDPMIAREMSRLLGPRDMANVAAAHSRLSFYGSDYGLVRQVLLQHNHPLARLVSIRCADLSRAVMACIKILGKPAVAQFLAEPLACALEVGSVHLISDALANLLATASRHLPAWEQEVAEASPFLLRIALQLAMDPRGCVARDTIMDSFLSRGPTLAQCFARAFPLALESVRRSLAASHRHAAWEVFRFYSKVATLMPDVSVDDYAFYKTFNDDDEIASINKIMTMAYMLHFMKPGLERLLTQSSESLTTLLDLIAGIAEEVLSIRLVSSPSNWRDMHQVMRGRAVRAFSNCFVDDGRVYSILYRALRNPVSDAIHKSVLRIFAALDNSMHVGENDT
ncbi:hypothetical protein [Mollivirus kamchatka]|nr:hypothetical protein [Mollivirus kamchatka]